MCSPRTRIRTIRAMVNISTLIKIQWNFGSWHFWHNLTCNLLTCLNKRNPFKMHSIPLIHRNHCDIDRFVRLKKWSFYRDLWYRWNWHCYISPRDSGKFTSVADEEHTLHSSTDLTVLVRCQALEKTATDMKVMKSKKNARKSYADNSPIIYLISQ